MKPSAKASPKASPKAEPKKASPKAEPKKAWFCNVLQLPDAIFGGSDPRLIITHFHFDRYVEATLPADLEASGFMISR